MAACDYANARASARRARLLGLRGLRELLLRPGTPERLGALADGCWRTALPLPGEGEGLEAVVQRLGTDASREARALLSFLSGRPQERFAALLRLLLDAPALEALLRGLVRRDPHGRVLAATWPTPGLGPELLAELAALPGPDRVADVLARHGSPLAPAAAAAVAAARKEPRLLHLGVTLQRELSAGARAAVAGRGEDARVATEVVATCVDHANATTLLAVETVAEPGELFVAGGRLDAAAFARLAELPLVQRRVRVAALIGAAGAGGVDPDLLADPAVAAQRFAAIRERALHRAARAHPHSIAVPLDALAERIGEARRLRVLLLGAEHGLPPEILLDLVEA